MSIAFIGISGVVLMRRMPTPSTSAPTTPSKMLRSFFSAMWTGELFSSLCHMIRAISKIMRPPQPMATPGLKAFHSDSRHMHSPRALKKPPIVPKIIAAKLRFFILLSLFPKPVWFDVLTLTRNCLRHVWKMFGKYENGISRRRLEDVGGVNPPHSYCGP